MRAYVCLTRWCAFAPKLEPKQFIFALRIAPATAVKLLDRIASRRIGKGQFFVQKLGQYWMQINIHTIQTTPGDLLRSFLSAYSIVDRALDTIAFIYYYKLIDLFIK